MKRGVVLSRSHPPQPNTLTAPLIRVLAISATRMANLMGGFVMVKEIELAQGNKYCAFCKSPFESRVYRGGSPKRFCSRRCQKAAWQQTENARDSNQRCNRSERGRESKRRWARSERGKAWFAKRRARPDYPAKTRARGAVRSALKRGELAKPTHCQDCSRKTDQLQAHHHKGYEAQLDVEWLCSMCHTS